MAAIMEMASVLKPGGILILVENFVEGLAELNKLRSQFDLHEIKTRWHNLYMSLPITVSFLKKHFRIDTQENIGNLYYILSRVVYAVLAKAEGKEPSYDHPINEIASKLPSLGSYGYSPNVMLVCRKKS
jgi:hypothetical protein